MDYIQQAFSGNFWISIAAQWVLILTVAFLILVLMLGIISNFVKSKQFFRMVFFAGKTFEGLLLISEILIIYVILTPFDLFSKILIGPLIVSLIFTVYYIWFSPLRSS